MFGPQDEIISRLGACRQSWGAAGEVLACASVALFRTQSERELASWLLRCMLAICARVALLAHGDYNSTIRGVHVLQADARWVLGQ